MNNNWQEEFDEKFPTLFDGNDGREGYDSLITNNVKNFISALLKEREAEIRKEEYDRCIKVLDIDHNNCLSPESCIGYQNALSNLINNPPQ
jgi:hypothetical protein